MSNFLSCVFIDKIDALTPDSFLQFNNGAKSELVYSPRAQQQMDMHNSHYYADN